MIFMSLKKEIDKVNLTVKLLLFTVFEFYITVFSKIQKT